MIRKLSVLFFLLAAVTVAGCDANSGPVEPPETGDPAPTAEPGSEEAPPPPPIPSG